MDLDQKECLDCERWFSRNNIRETDGYRIPVCPNCGSANIRLIGYPAETSPDSDLEIAAELLGGGND